MSKIKKDVDYCFFFTVDSEKMGDEEAEEAKKQQL